jgi:hypothetical protein
MMKKTVFLLLVILFLPFTTGHGISSLKLRSSYHHDFLRIVLEGAEATISRGTVNQRGDDIIVRFPHADLLLREEKVSVPYKIEKNVLIFSPGAFKKFKSFSLRFPSRLVIDVYQEPRKREVKRSLEAIRNRLRKKEKPFIKSKMSAPDLEIKGIETIVIDPGHGGYESGIITDIHKEKNVVLDIAKRLRALINRGSKKGFLTRKSDQFMSLKERITVANSKNADIFLSIHIGKHSDIVIYTPVLTELIPYEVKNHLINKGQEDFITNTSILGSALKEAIIRDFGDDMVSIKPLPYSMLSEIEAAALIVELPSFEDARYISELNTELANTMYRGINLYEEKTSY